MRLTHPTLATQLGIYHVAEAKALGLARDNHGHYPGTRVLPGVWSLLPPPLGQPAKRIAALKYAGAGARLTGISAAAHLGWRVALVDELIRTAIPNNRQTSSRDFVVIVRSRAEGSVVRVGLTLAAPELVLLDCAASVCLRELTALTAVAFQRRESSVLAMVSLLAKSPKLQGARSMRMVLAQLGGGAESIMEVDTLEVIVRLGFPTPECQMWIFDPDGALVAVADFYWDGVAIFYDGETHFDVATQRADRVKRARLEALGLQVPEITKGILDQESLLHRRLSAARAAADALSASRVGPPGWVVLTADEARVRMARAE